MPKTLPKSSKNTPDDMILYGKNITAHDDPLSKLSIEMLYRAIHSPKPESIALIRQLRIVRSLGPQNYAQLKRRLPYIVCGMFNPPVRRTENFAGIQYFILDIDHLSDKELTPDTLRQRIAADNRIVLCFESPSGDGMKVMFRLRERCSDSGLYSLFYRQFSDAFARQYNIEQVIDRKTSDATRACFLSYDPNVLYHPNAEPVTLEDYVDTANTLSLFSQPPSFQATQKHETKSEAEREPTPDIIDNIKNILELAKKNRMPKPEAYIPEQLAEVMDDLTHYITHAGVTIANIQNIQYGKKIQTRIGTKQAETNVFYGRRGFSVVISPRSGTDANTNELVSQLIQSFFDSNS